MPRASRYYIQGHVWHITRRCHKKEFQLKFGREEFVTATKEKLGFRAKGREVVVGIDGSFELKEPPAAYRAIFRIAFCN